MMFPVFLKKHKMKKIVTAVFSFVFAGIAVVAQIPNNGFENWTSMGSGSYDNPDNWSTLNDLTSSMGVYTCTKGSPGTAGDSYIQLESKSVSGMGVVPGVAVSGTMDLVTFKPKAGFAFTGRPQKLTGSWKYMGSGTDPGFIAVYLTKWNATGKRRDTVAAVKHTLTDMAMVWAAFSVDLNYFTTSAPDSALIILSASGPAPVEMSYLYVDDLSFTGSANGITAIENVISTLSLYPNPAADEAILELTTKQSTNIRLQLTDVTGKLVRGVNAGLVYGFYKHTLNTRELTKGIYFLKIIANDAVEVKKIVIQ
jgi:hypothetical protein